MGYNLSVACHGCKESAAVIRGQEARVIATFGSWHAGPKHPKEVRVDNGWSYPEDEFPLGYRDVGLELDGLGPLRTPDEWLQIVHLDLEIKDPDGWRDSDAPRFDEPISRYEFEERFISCTIGPRRHV